MILFDADTHTYKDDVTGEILPSVTQILKTVIFPTKYDGIPEDVLQKAADYGNAVHDVVETYALYGESRRAPVTSENAFLAFLDAKAIIELYGMKFTDAEKIITYSGPAGRYAGKYDLYGTINGEPVLVDIKTTSRLDKKYLSFQLGMYAAAMPEGAIKKCGCIWLPKGKAGKYVAIDPIDRETADFVLDRFMNER